MDHDDNPMDYADSSSAKCFSYKFMNHELPPFKEFFLNQETFESYIWGPFGTEASELKFLSENDQLCPLCHIPLYLSPWEYQFRNKEFAYHIYTCNEHKKKQFRRKFQWTVKK